MTTEPSARVTVNEKPVPGVNTDELTSEANTKKTPPSATAKLTVPVPALSSAASRLAAAPRAQFAVAGSVSQRSEEHTSELQSRRDLVCRLLLEKKKKRCVHDQNDSKQ